MTDDSDADVAKIMDATRAAIAEGEAIVNRARTDYALDQPRDADDGPRMQAWRQRSRLPEPLAQGLSDAVANAIGCIVASDHAGRHVTAGAALKWLREHYECIDPRELAADETTWPAFAAKHVPLSAERLDILIGAMVHHGGMLRCTRCGTLTRCACGCGRPYVGEHRWALGIEAIPAAPEPKKPSALDRARAAVAAAPEKSNRALATEIGVSFETVRRARTIPNQPTHDVSPQKPSAIQEENQ